MLRWIPVAVLALLAGCVTVPERKTEDIRPLTMKPGDGSGRIVIRPFVPTDAGSVRLNYSIGTTAFQAAVFDVTGSEIRYLGDIVSRGMIIVQPLQDLIEYHVQPGPRTLMLYMRTVFGADYVDFVELTVRSNQIEHAIITQGGMNDRPRFMWLPFDQRASRFCGFSRGLRAEDARAFFAAQGIPARPHAVRYCSFLANGSYVRPAETGWTSQLSKEHMAGLKEQWLPVWQKLPEKTPPTELPR
jgi:hypothetical protein